MLAVFIALVVVVFGAYRFKTRLDQQHESAETTISPEPPRELTTFIRDYPESRVQGYSFPELTIGWVEVLEVNDLSQGNASLTIRTNQDGVDINKAILLTKPTYLRPIGTVKPQDLKQSLPVGSMVEIRFFYYHDGWEENIQGLCENMPEVVSESESSGCLSYLASVTNQKEGRQDLESTLTSTDDLWISDTDYWINGIYVIE